jgi:predicted nucleic acid-binding Zn ribbon protein
MEHIKDIVSSLLTKLSDGKQEENKKIVYLWPRIAGETITIHTKPYKLNNNILFVKVNDASWAYELSQNHKESLLKRLNNELADGAIRDIRFIIGDIR